MHAKKLSQQDFALVAFQNGEVYPRYPIYDAGSTATSLCYFKKHAHKLPPEARSVAAHHLTKAAMQFNQLPPEDLVKKASMCYDTNFIDISGMKPDMQVVKEAQHIWAVEDEGEKYYPITTETQVKMAQAYWLENEHQFPAHIRRSFAQSVEKRAKELNLGSPEKIKEAAATSYASDVRLDNALARRTYSLPHDHEGQAFLSKIAALRSEMPVDNYAKCLTEFDIAYGLDDLWNRRIPDPFQSSYGLNKQAEVIWEDGPDRLTKEALMLLATEYAGDFDELFSDDIVSGFDLDPVGTFNKYPYVLKEELLG